MINFLALCGSLRQASINAMLLRVVQRIAPDNINVALYRSLDDLPLFNPDLEAFDPEPVAHLREQIFRADGIIIASPEYAHGVSGVMKNALDWMVGNESFVNKPVMLLNASPRSHDALDALRLTLQTMSAMVVDEAHVAVQIMGTKLDEDGIVNHPVISQTLLDGLEVFVRHIKSTRQ